VGSFLEDETSASGTTETFVPHQRARPAITPSVPPR
jgi:hypothetical protein